MMIRKFTLLATLVTCCLTTSFAQEDALVKIGEKNFSNGEFEFIYNKNNQISEDKKSKDEYLDLFINYKLKVIEAEHQQYDTLPSFQKELTYYRNELAKPYLTDKAVTENLMQEAYSRLGQEVDASHILIKTPKTPSPEDTLLAYNKIIDIKKQLSEGADFEALAAQYSEDPSAARNSGRLGYFTGFQMVYPFETAAFTTPIGQVSDVVRSNFGYHLVKIHDKRDARGEIQVAHIMKMYPPNASDEIKQEYKVKIDSIYALINDSTDFAEMAKEFSDDRNSAVNGGEMPFFTTGRMVVEFADASFALQNDGDISQPIETRFGWHIIKRLHKKGIKPYDEMKEEIKKRIANDERAFSGKKAIIQKLKLELNYTENSPELNKLKALFNSDISDSIFQSAVKNSDWLISFAEEKYSGSEFNEFLDYKRYTVAQGLLQFNKLSEQFSEDKLIAFENNRLEQKYPDFKYLVNEYHDGLLIFEISKMEIWDKASQDTTGLQAFYDNNKSNYIAPEHFEGSIFYCKSNKEVAKIKELIANNDSITADSIASVLNANEEVVNIETGSFNKGKHPVTDKLVWKLKNKQKPSFSQFKKYYTKGEIIPARQKELKETKGQVISDYQNHLEKLWIAELRKAYNPQIVGKLSK